MPPRTPSAARHDEPVLAVDEEFLDAVQRRDDHRHARRRRLEHHEREHLVHAGQHERIGPTRSAGARPSACRRSGRGLQPHLFDFAAVRVESGSFAADDVEFHVRGKIVSSRRGSTAGPCARNVRMRRKARSFPDLRSRSRRAPPGEVGRALHLLEVDGVCEHVDLRGCRGIFAPSSRASPREGTDDVAAAPKPAARRGCAGSDPSTAGFPAGRRFTAGQWTLRNRRWQKCA